MKYLVVLAFSLIIINAFPQFVALNKKEVLVLRGLVKNDSNAKKFYTARLKVVGLIAYILDNDQYKNYISAEYLIKLKEPDT